MQIHRRRFGRCAGGHLAASRKVRPIEEVTCGSVIPQRLLIELERDPNEPSADGGRDGTGCRSGAL